MQSISLSSDGGGLEEHDIQPSVGLGIAKAEEVKVGNKGRPVDPRAKRRYQALFDQQCRTMGNKDQRINGKVVRRIWERSKLPEARLKQIWYAF